MTRLSCLPVAFALTLAAGTALAGQIRVECYNDGNECTVTAELAKAFEASHPGVTIKIDAVPYKAILEDLPVQLAAGNGPDIARETDFGSISRYLLDISPYLSAKDKAYWEANFGPTLDWMRVKPGDKGIYGLASQLTVTGPFVNKTLFDQAGVKLPGPKATWDDWAAATRKVAKATGVPYAMAWDRTGHRFAGPAISYGAKYFTADGKPAVVDAGFSTMAQKFVAWNKDGTVDKDVWGGVGGATYRDAFAQFKNAQIVMYLSGSWQIHRMETQIGNAFDWTVVPNPCGPAACSGMPGGAAFVALKTTKDPKDVAAFLNYLASKPVYAKFEAETNNIPAHLGLQKEGIDYKVSPTVKAALDAFKANATTLSPVAYKLQGYPYNRAIFNATAERLGQAIVGEMTVNDALKRITEDVNQSVATATKK